MSTIPKFEFALVTNVQICCAISWLGPYKAPGAESISNAMLIHCADLLLPHIVLIYLATFMLGAYPEQWQNSVTIVPRKLYVLEP